MLFKFVPHKSTDMQTIAAELESIINQHMKALQEIPEDKMTFKPSPSKWSKKEIMGHMVDSAQNNIRRLVVGQYEDTPKITYNQDKWVAISDYQNYDTLSLIRLWYLLNNHLAVILRKASPEVAQRQCQTESLHTLEWIAQDYIKHLKHHVHQVLELEPVVYP